ncbi:hypothetical protein HDU76_011991 [Blyttiomyces sp. JEL0837]|nr:hypothetical protein HDU76_011991 [Blyttiomyces sp. JEL0837]
MLTAHHPPQRQSAAGSSSSAASDTQTSSSASGQSASVKAEPGLPRLVVTKLVLRNFKSYAGTIEIGPFHKSFSSIVGPNGSGKSNVIDALLFVFGYKAKKMRQSKLVDLIHHSENFPNLDSCGVEIHMQEIIDKVGDDFEVVPNSQITVSRTVEKSKGEKSTYRINGRTCTLGDVTSLLSGKGVDLTHKRFLILQGEVESIALMKPKAVSEHEDGLLEYLEDIIGTTNYHEAIEKSTKLVEELNLERDEKLTRLKMVEKEKNAVEPRKKEAEEFLKLENNLTRKKNLLYQANIREHNVAVTVVEERKIELKQSIKDGKAAQERIRADITQFETTNAGMLDRLKQLATQSESLRDEVQTSEKLLVEFRENEKHLDANCKKISKQIQKESTNLEDLEKKCASFDGEMESINKKSASLSAKVVTEEKKLQKIQDELQGSTAELQKQLETHQIALSPWVEKLNQAEATLSVATSERSLLEESLNATSTALAVAEQKREHQLEVKASKDAELESGQSRLQQLQTSGPKCRQQIEKLKENEVALKGQLDRVRQDLAQIRNDMQVNQSRSRALRCLMEKQQQGEIQGICGRLGDLGIIDDKYDIAISTACPLLDNIVVETVEVAQRCIQILKSSNQGRATFLCLDKIKSADLSPISTPEDVPRLFDLVQAKEDRFRPVFFQVLGNTLVANNLTQANNIAFSKTRRYKVVTLDGKVIDTSGTISGGGSKPISGSMKKDFNRGQFADPQAMAALESKERKLAAEFQEVVEAKGNMECQLVSDEKEMESLTRALSKASLDSAAAEKLISELSLQMDKLRKQKDPERKEDSKRLESLNSQIRASEKTIAGLQKTIAGLNENIKSVQDQILEAGGSKLRHQKSVVDDLQIEECSEHSTKLTIEQGVREKSIAKIQKTLSAKEKDLTQVQEQLEDIQRRLLEEEERGRELSGKLEEAVKAYQDEEANVLRLKKELEVKTNELKKLSEKEIEMTEALEEEEKKLRVLKKELVHLQKSLAELKIQRSGFEEEPEADLIIFSDEQLAEAETSILEEDIEKMEEKLSTMKPNMSVFVEYQQKLSVYLARAKDVEEITSKRDSIKLECEALKKRRFDEFMSGFTAISLKLKEMYQMITLGGNAELELVDSMDPFSEGIVFSVMPPKKSWKNIANLSGGEKTLSSLALVFALHHYKPTPLYFMDEIDAALDFRNVSIVANYIKERTRNAQFIVISLRNNMFELADRLVGIYKTNNTTKSITINPFSLDCKFATA